MASLPALLAVGYLLLLTAAACAARRTVPTAAAPAQRFLILVPAHNEERLLPELLRSLARLDYPAGLYAVHVVADNCADGTAQAARAAGAVVHERLDAAVRGKGQALNWLLDRVAGEPHDAVVFLDADSVVSPNFLSAMAARLERGERALQAYYAVRDPERSVAIGLRYAALAALHYLRPLGRMALGASAGLKGNGMVFGAEVLRGRRWSAAVTEDIELHMALVLDGERVHFAPEAVVWGEMPATLARSASQQQRWEGGRLQMARKYVPRLLAGVWVAARVGQGRQAYVLLDAALEHLIPPFSLLAGYSLLLLAASLAALGLALPGAWAVLALSAALLAGQLLYLLAGLRLARAPRRVYAHLAYAPVYVVWKLGQLGRAWLGRLGPEWVRTTRNEVA